MTGRQRPTPRLGLRTRVAMAFGGLALALSLLLAGVAWIVMTRFLVAEHESTSRTQAVADVQLLDATLGGGHAPPGQVLSQLTPNALASGILTYQGQWYATSLTLGPRVLPTRLREDVVDGRASEQRITVGGAPYLLIGLPLASGQDAFFGLFSMADLDRTFHVLSTTLIISAAVTAAVGLLLGRAASVRALAPLTDLTAAAAEAARGNLDVRLPASGDPDLAVVATSFNETADALQRRVVADARFAGDVSHELRTPLTTMLNAAQLVERHARMLPEHGREALGLLTTELTRFRHMVVDLIEISRSDSGDDHLAMEPVVIGDLVRLAADGAAGRRVTSVAPDARGLEIRADKRRVEQIVANLVRNADQHGRGCVRVQVERTARGARILVDDAGPGVPAALRDRVFERFGRAPSSDGAAPHRAGQRESGVGLGLAIVERHVRVHAGAVEITDRPGGGARFVVDLPADAR